VDLPLPSSIGQVAVQLRSNDALSC
jgi:hypothetical protein